jgi:hypothetical protein
MTGFIMPFKLGQRVKCIKEYDDNRQIIGKLGYIINVTGYGVTVEFDNEFEMGHNGHNRGHDARCWDFSGESGLKCIEVVNVAEKQLNDVLKVKGI